VKNKKLFRRRSSRTLAPGYYSEKSLAQRAAGVDTEASKKKRVREPPADEVNETIQLTFDHGTPAQIAALKRDYPKMFHKDGCLKNRNGYSKAPVEKPKKKDTGRGKLEGVGMPEYPSMRIRELYRHGTADRRAALWKHYPEYAAYFKSKGATRIPRRRSCLSKSLRKMTRTSSTQIPAPPKYPSINIRRDYLYGSTTVCARVRNNFSTYAW
jgi:hypothetical protein